MANKTIPELTASSTILPTHVIPFDTGTQTFKATVADLAETFANLERDRGLPAWNSGTTYGVGTIVRDATSQNGFLYVSLAGSNLNHALTDSLWWRKITDPVVGPITGNTTLGADHVDAILLVDTTLGPITLTLFTGGAPRHTKFTVKDIKGTFASNPVTIARVGSEKIEDVAANYVCNKRNRSYTFATNGTDWFVTGTSFNTKPSEGEFIGEESSQTASGSNAKGANIVANTANVYAAIIQQRTTTPNQNYGLLLQAGTSASDHCQTWRNTAGGSLAGLRGDGVLEIFGSGIKFNPTQVASSDSNTLDDYEEGTFTPSLVYDTGAPSFGYGNRGGVYVKIGKKVFFYLGITLTSFSKGSGSGNVRVGSLPFTAETFPVGVIAPCTTIFQSWNYSNIPVAYVSTGTSQILIQIQASGLALGLMNDPSATSSIYVSGSYTTA